MEKLKIYQVDGVSDYLEASSAYNGRIQIECYELWAGDTETGFGQGGSVQLTKEQAIELSEWLKKAANNL